MDKRQAFWESKKAIAFLLGLVGICLTAWRDLNVAKEIVTLVAMYVGGQGYVDAKVRTEALKQERGNDDGRNQGK